MWKDVGCKKKKQETPSSNFKADWPEENANKFGMKKKVVGR